MIETPLAARLLDPTILRENDIRGLVGETLFEADARAIGLAFGSLLIEQGGRTAAVGFDGRLSSPDLEAALVGGLRDAGVDVWRSGLGPSPMLYYAREKLATDAGLMITGSHNPAAYNGIKMTMFGRPFYADHIQNLGLRAARGDFTRGTGKVENYEVLTAYVDRLLDDYRGDKKLKIAWDPGNGAAGDALVALTQRLPGEHFLINEKIDGTFPAHHPDPTVEENLVQLKALVADNGCDIGIGFDGDGDRIGIIDGHGRVLWGDQLLVLLAEEVLASHPGAPIITDIKASQLFSDEITRMGGQPVLWKVGHAHIKTKMMEMDSPLAGEMSAHIFFRDRHYGYDDALYAAVRLLSILASGERSLADVYDALPHFENTPELRFDCAEARKYEIIEEVRNRLAKTAGLQINDLDGLRVNSDHGWWLLRVSNTQAAISARCESTTPAGLLRLKRELAEQLRLSGITSTDL
ncbi:MAG: phosphomannomutase/phosphoglucomutase [Rhodospirillales bacterium]|nr:phosphomannomutase/phosphoglucomutase [Rhodospirillales bacterium]